MLGQPPRDRGRDPRRKGQHRQPVKGPVRLGVIRVGRIPRNAQQHRRHAKGQRDLARGRELGLVELHVRGAEPHRLPVQPPLQQHRTTRIARALMVHLDLADQPVILFGAQRALPVQPLVDDRTTGPGGIVQQSLRPGAGAVMDIQSHRRRLKGRQTVMVVLRMKALDVADRIGTARHVKAMLAPTHGIFIGHRPAILAGHHAHPVRAQDMQLFGQPRSTQAHRLQIAVARQQHLPEQRLEQLGPALPRIGTAQQIQHRMGVIAPLVILADQRHRRRGFRDQLDAAKADRIADEPAPRQTTRIARRPDRPARPAGQGHDPARRAGLPFGNGRAPGLP